MIKRVLLAAMTLSATIASGCASRIAPIPGVEPSIAALPALPLPIGAHKLTFRWELNGDALVSRGEGVARMASPDSARVDLFLAGGFGGAAAILVGDTLTVPPGNGAAIQRMIPPPPLMWAALGRLALPPIRDTLVRVQGDTLRASLGAPVQWRLTVVRNELTRVERIDGDRIVEWVQRVPGKSVRYELAGRRSLVLDIETQQPTAPFDASVWRF